jgi:hypothetical protein
VTERIRQYSAIEDIGDDFGVDSPEYEAATIFFSQSPKPTLVYIGRWAKTLAEGEAGAVETCCRRLMPLCNIPTGMGWRLPTAPIWLRLT